MKKVVLSLLLLSCGSLFADFTVPGCRLTQENFKKTFGSLMVPVDLFALELIRWQATLEFDIETLKSGECPDIESKNEQLSNVNKLIKTIDQLSKSYSADFTKLPLQ